MWEFNMIKDKVHVCILHESTSPCLTHARPKHKGDKTNMNFAFYYIYLVNTHAKYHKLHSIKNENN